MLKFQLAYCTIKIYTNFYHTAEQPGDISVTVHVLYKTEDFMVTECNIVFSGDQPR